MKMAINCLRNRAVWHWWGFYAPGFGLLRFGAGFWLRYIVTLRWLRRRP